MPLWRQQSAAAPDLPVLWDYHVLLLAQLEGQPTLVLDLDRCGKVGLMERVCRAVACWAARAGCSAVRCVQPCCMCSTWQHGQQVSRLHCRAALRSAPACSTLPFPCPLSDYRRAALLGDDSSLAPQYRRHGRLQGVGAFLNA